MISPLTILNFRIQCPECLKLMHRDSVKQHIISVHLKQHNFHCDFCGFQTSRRTRLSFHLRSSHNLSIEDKKAGLKKQCTQCTHCGTLVRDIRRHVDKVHSKIKNVFCDVNMQFLVQHPVKTTQKRFLGLWVRSIF